MSNQINISVKNLDETQHIKDYVIKRLEKLERFLSDVEETNIDLTYIKTARNAADRYSAQLTIFGKHVTLRTEEFSTDILAAFDKSMEKMQRKIERYKGKREHLHTDKSTVAQEVPDENVADEDDYQQAVIVRRKQFTLHPMDEIEALEQMRLLGHDNFFVFFNANTSNVNVLYKRKDGTYGLIEPQLG